MIFVGIDGGKQGAICYIKTKNYEFAITAHDVSKPIELFPMPIVKAQKGRDEYDIGTISQLLRDGLNFENKFVTLERAVPMPPRMPGGSLAQFNRGVQRGFEWLLTALEIPYQAIAARTWQKEMLAGTPGTDTKQRSILAAQRLFPSVDLRRTERSRKPDHNYADSLLLAEYGRRTYNGGRNV